MAHVHDKLRIKKGNKAWPMYIFFVYYVHGLFFVSHLYSLFIMYMGHVLFPIFILCLSCTWAMFCFLSLFFFYHFHGPFFVFFFF
jgi:hypothetical protein